MLYVIASLLILSFALQLLASKFKRKNKENSQNIRLISYVLIGIAILLTLFF